MVRAMQRQKKDLSSLVISSCSDITWRVIRDAFYRLSFRSFDDFDLCAQIYKERMKAELKNCHCYNDCVNFLYMFHNSDQEQYSDGLKKQLSILAKIKKEYDQIRAALLSESMIESFGDFKYKIAKEGHTLKMQRLTMPITRGKANQILMDVIGMAEKINADLCAPYYVSSLYVYGSYLSEKEVLGDLDIAVDLLAKGNRFEDPSWNELNCQFAAKHRKKDGEKAVIGLLRVHRAVALTFDYVLEGMVDEGNAISKRVYSFAECEQ